MCTHSYPVVRMFFVFVCFVFVLFAGSITPSFTNCICTLLMITWHYMDIFDSTDPMFFLLIKLAIISSAII